MKVVGIVLVVMALVIGIVPQFTRLPVAGQVDRAAQRQVIPMKCHWTGRAELGLAVPLLAVGAMMVGSRRKEGRRRSRSWASCLGWWSSCCPPF